MSMRARMCSRPALAGASVIAVMAPSWPWSSIVTSTGHRSSYPIADPLSEKARTTFIEMLAGQRDVVAPAAAGRRTNAGADRASEPRIGEIGGRARGATEAQQGLCDRLPRERRRQFARVGSTSVRIRVVRQHAYERVVGGGDVGRAHRGAEAVIRHERAERVARGRHDRQAGPDV